MANSLPPENERNVVVRDRTSYPSNSRDKRGPQHNPKQVVKGNLKTGLSTRIVGGFLAEKGKNMGHHLLFEVLWPAVKSMLYDMGIGALDSVLPGESRKNPYNRNGYVVRYDRPTANKELTATDRIYHNFNAVTFATYGEAKVLLDTMKDAVACYGKVTVGDFYVYAGIRQDFSDNNYGWYDLSTAKIVASGREWSVRLPVTVPITE